MNLEVPPPPLPTIPINAAKLTVGCPIIDGILHGGISCNGITEIVAESGMGKTQLALQLLLMAQLPASQGGLSGASLYLHSELAFPLRRLYQLSVVWPQIPKNPLDRIFVEAMDSVDHLLDVLCRLDTPIRELNIKLFVIDSIAALFRGEFDNTPADLRRRLNVFFNISSKLKMYAHKFNLVVVVTNQVSDVLGCSGDIRVGNPEYLCSSGRKVTAALGLSWANCVNTRLFMWREEEQYADEQGNLEIVQIRKFIRIVFAPHLPDSSCEFVITREGIFGV